MQCKKTLGSLICLALMLSTMSALPTSSSREHSPAIDIHRLKLDPPRNSNGSISISGMPPPTNPYPLHDQLTECTHRVQYLSEVYLDVQLYGYWHELQELPYAIIEADPRNGTNIGYYSIIDISYVYHQYLCFYFDEPMSLASCHFIKYYQALSPGHTGFCQFAFFSFNEKRTEAYFAYLNYSHPIDCMFHRLEWDIQEHSNWGIDFQFDWNNVAGFLFCAEGDFASNTMWIDAPKLYFFDEPLPVNEVIDEAEGFAVGFIQTPGDGGPNASRIRMLAQLWHGNITYYPSKGSYREHWLLKIYLEDFYYTTFPQTIEHPSFIRLTIRLCDEAEEHVPAHWPQAGYVGSARTSTGLSYGGIGFSVTSAEKYISYSRYYQNGMLNIEWYVEPSRFIGTVSGFLFFDFCEFAIGFTTPVGYKPWAFINAEVKIYGLVMPFDWWPECSYRYTNSIPGRSKWLYVDPPGSDPLEPGTTEPIITPERLAFVYVNEIQTYQLNGDYRGPQKTVFRRGDYICFLVNYTWGFNATTQIIHVSLITIDDQENTIFAQGTSAEVGYSLPLYRYEYVYGWLPVTRTAPVGEAKILVRIMSVMPHMDPREYARMEMNITIVR